MDIKNVQVTWWWARSNDKKCLYFSWNAEPTLGNMRTRMLVTVRNKTKTTNVFVFEELRVKFYGEKMCKMPLGFYILVKGQQNILVFTALTWWRRTLRYSARRPTPSAEPWPPSLPSASSSGSSGCGTGTTPGWTQTQGQNRATPPDITVTILSPSSSTVWSRSRIVINMEI